MNATPVVEADIALLLEGTFPYVSGGVSSWVNQIIRAYPEYRFAIVFLGSRPEDYGPQKYELPANVVHIETHYLYGELGHNEKPKGRAGNRKAIELSADMHEHLHDADDPAAALGAFRTAVGEIGPWMDRIGEGR